MPPTRPVGNEFMSLQKHYFGQLSQPLDVGHCTPGDAKGVAMGTGGSAQGGCHDVLCAIAATLDKYSTCRRFVVQDKDETAAVLLDVHRILFNDDDGSVVKIESRPLGTRNALEDADEPWCCNVVGTDSSSMVRQRSFPFFFLDYYYFLLLFLPPNGFIMC